LELKKKIVKQNFLELNKISSSEEVFLEGATKDCEKTLRKMTKLFPVFRRFLQT